MKSAINRNLYGRAKGMEKPLKFKEIVMPYPNPENTYTDYDRKLQPKMDFESGH